MSARRGARSGRQPRVLAPGRRRLVVFIFPLSSLVLLNSVYNHDAELFPAPPDKEVARSLPTAPRLAAREGGPSLLALVSTSSVRDTIL